MVDSRFYKYKFGLQKHLANSHAYFKSHSWYFATGKGSIHRSQEQYCMDNSKPALILKISGKIGSPVLAKNPLVRLHQDGRGVLVGGSGRRLGASGTSSVGGQERGLLASSAAGWRLGLLSPPSLTYRTIYQRMLHSAFFL